MNQHRDPDIGEWSGPRPREAAPSRRGRWRPSARLYARDVPVKLMIILSGSVLLNTALTAHPEGRDPRSSTQVAGQLQIVPVTASVSAIVDFSELAASAVPTPAGPLVGLVIPSPMAPPEPDASQTRSPDPPAAAPLPEASPRAIASPNPSLTFEGLDDIPKVGSGTIVIPPDTDGAVGLNRVMVGLNNNYRIQNKANGSVVSTVSIDTFWAASGGSGFFDPKTLYDPINDRWIITVLSDRRSANSSVEIGVSQTSDPSGSYHIFRVDADATDTDWADFPCIGFNKNWVAVNVNMFTNSSDAYTSSKMLIVDYAQLRTGTFSGSFAVGTGFCTSPAATYSSTESTLYAPTHLSSAGGTYRLDTITGTPSVPVYNLGGARNRGLTWTQPGGNILPQAAPLSGASACGGTPCMLESQDAQIRSTPVVRDGFLYYSQTVGIPAGGLTHTGVQWTKLDASGGGNTGNVVDGGRVDDATATSSNGGKWYNYPHIAVNQHGDIILGFSQFASNQYPSAGYTVHHRTDAAGTMRDPLIYKAGEDYYNKDFGSGRNRWGDYSKAQVDPTNDSDLWVLNEYAKARVGTDDGATGTNSSRWGTWWAKVTFQSTETTMSTMGAYLHDGGVTLRWRTGLESGNLGFNVYRDDGSGLTRLNPAILAGSALIAGTDTPLLSGLSYDWGDSGGRPDALYWVEDVDLSGTGTWHGPVAPDRVATLDRPLPRILTPALEGSRSTSGSDRTTDSPGVVLPAHTTVRILRQSELASASAVKLQVREAGWYRLTHADLINGGLNPGTDPRKLQMYVDGREIAIRVTGEEDGRLDLSDLVQFYGVGLDIPSTDRRIYWLKAGSEPGRRIPSMEGAARGPVSRSFPLSFEIRERAVYVSSLRNGEAENFFGAVVGSKPVEHPIDLHHLDAESGEPVAVEVVLQGVTQAQHRVQVSIRDMDLGEVVFAAQSRGLGSFTVPSGLLSRDANGIRLAALGGGADTSLVESIRVTYPHAAAADHDLVRFPIIGGKRFVIGGFGSSAVRVLDVTDPDEVIELGRQVRRQENGYEVDAVSVGRGRRTVVAFTENRVRRPEAILANEPSRLRESGNAADMLIISHGSFLKSLEPLRSLRSRHGLATHIVNVEDIYDEFSYGHKTPHAIRDFLQFASASWQRPPRYVLLAGDASFDPRNYLGKGESDFVPTRMIDTGNMETASDDWFVDFEGTGSAPIAVGRLPVRSAAEADRMIAKILRYEESDRQGGALFVTDVSDTFDFRAPTAELKALAARSMAVQEIARGPAEVGFEKVLLDSLNRGHRIVNYMGHGSADIWRANFLTSEAARGLSNADNLPFFVAVTCLNGYFVNPALESLGEALLRAEQGGAAAVWTSTAVSDPGSQAAINVQLFQFLFNSSKPGGVPLTIGEATTLAKHFVKDREVQRTYVLLGDPAMRLR